MITDAPVIFNNAAFVEGGVIGRRIESTEYVVLVSDDGAHDFNDVRLVLDLIAVRRDRHQRRTKADCQVVRVHHVLIAEFRQAGTDFKHSIKHNSNNNAQIKFVQEKTNAVALSNLPPLNFF